MLSLLSTLGGLLISGLPKLLDFFQSKADQRHELALAQLQNERELALAVAHDERLGKDAVVHALGRPAHASPITAQRCLQLEWWREIDARHAGG